jgi:hypothetical protein
MDDRGHALLAGIAARFHQEPYDGAGLVRINLSINLAGILALAVLLTLCGAPVTAVATLWAGTIFGIPGTYPSSDAMASFFGEFCLAMAGALAFQKASDPAMGRRSRLIFGIAGFILLASATLLREALGLIGIGTAVLVLLVRGGLSPGPRGRHAFLCAGLIFVATAASQGTRALFALRNRLFDVQPGTLVASHGISHAFYQGLGWGANPFGISYGDDAAGWHAVEGVSDPHSYATPEYFRKVRGAYARLVMRAPGAVLKVYGAKAREVFGAPVRLLGMPGYLLLFGALCVWAGLLRQGGEPKTLWALGAVLAANAGLILQGILIRPDALIMYPIKMGIAVSAALALETLLVRTQWFRAPNRSDAV